MEAAAHAAGAGAGAGLGLLGALWLGAGAALRTWNRPRARGYGRHMGQRPAVAVVLPVKGHHAHSEANWMNQLALDYEGGDVQVRGERRGACLSERRTLAAPTPRTAADGDGEASFGSRD